jgi:hypothetical protein
VKGGGRRGDTRRDTRGGEGEQGRRTLRGEGGVTYFQGVDPRGGFGRVLP